MILNAITKRNVLYTGFAVVILFGLAMLFRSPLKSDRTLASDFARHKVRFERIVQMMNEDEEVTNVSDWGVSFANLNTWRGGTEPGFSPVRWHLYRELLKSLGDGHVHSVSRVDGMIVFSTGDSDRSPINEFEGYTISKDFVYSLSEPSPLVWTLDWSSFNASSPKFTKIDENWYLRFDSGIYKHE